MSNRITRTAIRKLKAGETLREDGIDFKRLPNGDGVYSINIMVEGQRIHRVVGKESDGTTLTQAREYKAKIISDAKNNRLNLPKGRKNALTFTEAVEKYFDQLVQSGGKDLRMKRARFKYHLTPFFGDMPLSKINTLDVETYKQNRLTEDSGRSGGKTKPATVNRELAALSHLLNCAIEWGWITVAPCNIKKLNENNDRIVYLTEAQCKRLVECAENDINPQVRVFIEVALGTGMRRMEILSMKWAHVSFDNCMIHIPDAKAGAREQPMTRHVSNVLKRYRGTMADSSEWVFPSTSSKVGHTTDIRKAFRRVVTAAGLDPDIVVRHTLRHTAITHLVQGGVDLPTVKRISGHKTLSMVERYSHQNGQHISAAMSVLDRKLGMGASQDITLPER